jgi:hypothetical protein
MLQPEIQWHPRPRSLREFPEDTQVRLRQLDFNRTIVVHIGNNTFHIRRIGLNQFLCCEADSRTSAS